eukprot:4430219-Amphidinium_carterae.1
MAAHVPSPGRSNRLPTVLCMLVMITSLNSLAKTLLPSVCVWPGYHCGSNQYGQAGSVLGTFLGAGPGRRPHLLCVGDLRSTVSGSIYLFHGLAR